MDNVVDELLRNMRIATDTSRSIDERIDATLVTCRLSDHEDTKDNPVQQAENDAFIAALMKDERGHEIIVRTVLRLTREANKD